MAQVLSKDLLVAIILVVFFFGKTWGNTIRNHPQMETVPGFTRVYLALPHHRICLLSLLEMPRLGESHGYKGPAQDNLGTMVK